MYRGMVLARAFDLKAVSLQRTGRLGTYATSLGQEAVGVASAMRPEDVLLPSYRDNAALLWRGVAVNNNQWAISVPLKQQTGSQTLAQKAVAADLVKVGAALVEFSEGAEADTGTIVGDVQRSVAVCLNVPAGDAAVRWRQAASISMPQRRANSH